MTLKEYLNNGDLFAKENGIQLTDIKPNYAKAQVIVTNHHKNAGNICQGGVIFTLADIVFAALVNTRGNLAFAINSTIFYHISGQIGDTLTAEGHFISEHPKIPSAEVVIRNQDGTHIATFTAQGYTKRIATNFTSLE